MRLSREPMPRVLKKDIIERIIGGQLTNLEKTITDDATELLNTAIALKKAGPTKSNETENLLNKKDETKEPTGAKPTPINQKPSNQTTTTTTAAPKINNQQEKIAATKKRIDEEKKTAQLEKDRKTTDTLNQVNTTNNTNVLFKTLQLTAQTFGPIQLGLLFIAVIALYAGFIITIYYFVITLNKIRQRFDISDPLNKETIDWEVIKSFSKYTGSFNFLLFLILPAVSILCIILIFLVNFIFPTKINITGEVKLLIAGIGMTAFIMLLVQLVISMLLSSQIKAIGGKLVKLNKDMYYRFTSDINILKKLQEMKDSGYDIEENIIEFSVNEISESSTPEQIAKIFYTATLFIYYHNLLGTRDKHLYEALKVFSIPNILLSKSKASVPTMSPSDFFPKFGTYIPAQDVSFSLNLSEKVQDLYNKNRATIDDAFQVYRRWMTELNMDANSIYPGKAITTFYILLIITFIIQSIPVIVTLGVLFGAGPNSPLGKLFGYIQRKIL